MFTGLIKDIGVIKSITQNAEGKIFVIETKKLIEDINVDDSVATNGVCLTATSIKNNTFSTQAVHVTLEKSSLGQLKVGSPVNLELALRASDRLGGHIVQGHVNGTAKLSNILKRGNNWELSFRPDKQLFKYIIAEGSISIDGISLTVFKSNGSEFSVSIIPHTYENTNLGHKRTGEIVNIEVDIMAKYLENFLKFEQKKTNIKDLL